MLAQHAGLHRFLKGLIAFRQHPDVVTPEACLTLNQLLQRTRVEWHGVHLDRPDWSDESHTLAFTARLAHWRFVLHAMFNAYLTFELPAGDVTPYRWQRCVDTAFPSPEDFHTFEQAPVLADSTYRVQPRSCVVLASQLPPGASGAVQVA